jgi:CheY-like chemotaxis protein
MRKRNSEMMVPIYTPKLSAGKQIARLSAGKSPPVQQNREAGIGSLAGDGRENKDFHRHSGLNLGKACLSEREAYRYQRAIDSDPPGCYFHSQTLEGELSQIRLLSVVDDDASVRKATGRLIKSLGFTVDVFASGEEFLLFGRPRVTSCLVLDVQMPGMSGLQLQSHLAAAGYRIPIIFITAYPDARSRTQALAAGAVDFLNKPFGEEALLSGIRSALKLSDGDMHGKGHEN